MTFDVNDELVKMAELNKILNSNMEKLGIAKLMENKEAVEFGKKISKFGERGAHVLVPGKYVGHECAVVIQKKKGGTKK